MKTRYIIADSSGDLRTVDSFSPSDFVVLAVVTEHPRVQIRAGTLAACCETELEDRAESWRSPQPWLDFDAYGHQIHRQSLAVELAIAAGV